LKFSCRPFWIFLFAGLLFMPSSGTVVAAQKTPALSVAVSIKPLHSLISGLMEGTGSQPSLIVPGGASPHAYSLRPSDARKIDRARLIFWIGPGLESFLVKPLQSLADKARIVTFLPQQEATTARQGQDHNHHGASPHIWLSPIEAIGIVKIAAARLAEADPGNADRYRHNAAVVNKRLRDLQAEISNRLRPVRSKPFIVFHDAYDHLAKAFGLTIAGVVTVSPDRAPGARRIATLRKLMAASKASCLFGEPQIGPRRLNMIVENIKNARTGILDPLGANIPAGKDMYFILMRANAQALVDCLSG